MSNKDVSVLPSLHTILSKSGMDGANGNNRLHGKSVIYATNDLEAIESWLKVTIEEKNPHTSRAYRREAERLLRWAVVKRNKPLSSLNLDDMKDYRLFLIEPSPASDWIGRPQKQDHKDWRPFTGPLSSRSVVYAETVLKRLFSWLVMVRYLRLSPYAGIAKNTDSNKQMNVKRSFSKSEWLLIKEYLINKLSSCEHGNTLEYLHYCRVYLILRILYGTGLRLHEIAKVSFNDIKKVERNDKTRYWLTVIGKGNKLRDVPISNGVIEVLNEAYLVLTGKEWRTVPKAYPLIPRLRAQSKISLKPLAIHRELKTFFEEIALSLSLTDPDSAAKIARASTHWMRHTHGTHAVDMNIPLTIVRDNLGHSNIAITSLYLHTEEDERHDAMEMMV